MKKRRTSKVSATRGKRRRREKVLRLDVSSGRILWLDFLRKGRWLGISLLWAGIALTCFYTGRYALHRIFIENAEFQLASQEDMELITNGYMNPSRAWSASGLELGKSVFSVNLSRVKQRLEALPEVGEARVTRRLPRTIRIDIVERVPVAWLECQTYGINGRDCETGMLVDAESVCFPCAFQLENALRELPVVVLTQSAEQPRIGMKLEGREALRALHLLEISRQYLDSNELALQRVEVLNSYSLRAVTHAGVALIFGMYEHERQLEDMLLIQNHAEKSHRTLKTVNLLTKRNVPVTFQEDSWVEPVEPRREEPRTREEKDLEMILKRS